MLKEREAGKKTPKQQKPFLRSSGAKSN